MDDAPAPRRPFSDAALIKATGRSWQEWFAVLDAVDAARIGHAATARLLVDEHGVDGWRAQSITVGYERERGLRATGQRADGSFEANASVTMRASAEAVFDAFADPELRATWLPEPELSRRSSRRPKSMRFDMAGDRTRLAVTLVAVGPQKTRAQVAHERLPDAEARLRSKELWKRRLTALKHLVETEL